MPGDMGRRREEEDLIRYWERREKGGRPGQEIGGKGKKNEDLVRQWRRGRVEEDSVIKRGDIRVDR